MFIATQHNSSHQEYTHNDSICAVVVTHNIGRKITKNLSYLLEIVDYITVIDNDSQDGTLAALHRFSAEHPDRCTVISHPVNNLAKAQNIGITHAKNRDFAWILLLDHDSLPERDMIQEQLSAYYHYAHPEHIGMIIPNSTDAFSKREAKFFRHWHKLLCKRTPFADNAVYDDVMMAISSGSLIPSQIFDVIGLMDESLSIDNVDFDFSLRMIRSGKKILAVKKAVLHHQLGKCRDHHLPVGCITTSNHNPMRRYYIYRNRLRLWRKHGLAVPAYLLCDIGAICYDILKISFFEANRPAKFKAIRAGIRDAFAGVTGTVDMSRYTTRH